MPVLVSTASITIEGTQNGGTSWLPLQLFKFDGSVPSALTSDNIGTAGESGYLVHVAGFQTVRVRASALGASSTITPLVTLVSAPFQTSTASTIIGSYATFTTQSSNASGFTGLIGSANASLAAATNITSANVGFAKTPLTLFMSYTAAATGNIYDPRVAR